MNFTHLLPSGATAPQELLQRFQNYLIVSVLDDDTAKLVEVVAGFQMQWSDTTLCQIVRPLDFALALPGTPLHHIKTLVQRDPVVPSHLDFSFLACASRIEITAQPQIGGLYVPLFLTNIDSKSDREAVVLTAVSDALQRSRKLQVDEAVRSRLQSAAAAASLVASLFRIKLGLP